MKKIEFTKSFSSPVYGNVYIGKQAMVKSQEAEKLIKLGNAVLAQDKKVEVKAKSDGNSKSKRGKKSSKSRSK